MANADSNPDNLSNPIIGLFPEDTLQACSQVLSFLAGYRVEDCPGEDEKMGLYNIHCIVKKALDYEISRVGLLRKASRA